MYKKDMYLWIGGHVVRTQVYLTEEEKAGLEKVAQNRGVRQSDLIREAIDNLLESFKENSRRSVLEDIAGIWQNHTDVPDIPKMRAKWSQRSKQ